MKTTKVRLFKHLIYFFVFSIGYVLYERIRIPLLTGTISSIEYILYSPIGIKQNRVLMAIFRKVYRSVLDFDCPFNTLKSLRTCCQATFFIYNQIFKILREFADLLNNRTYNPHMKRYDTIYLQTDQAVLSLIFITLILIVFANVILLYVFFLAVYFISEPIAIALAFFEDITSDTSTSIVFNNLKHSWIRMRGLRYQILTGKLIFN